MVFVQTIPISFFLFFYISIYEYNSFLGRQLDGAFILECNCTDFVCVRKIVFFSKWKRGKNNNNNNDNQKTTFFADITQNTHPTLNSIYIFM